MKPILLQLLFLALLLAACKKNAPTAPSATTPAPVIRHVSSLASITGVNGRSFYRYDSSMYIRLISSDSAANNGGWAITVATNIPGKRKTIYYEHKWFDCNYNDQGKIDSIKFNDNDCYVPLYVESYALLKYAANSITITHYYCPTSIMYREVFTLDNNNNIIRLDYYSDKNTLINSLLFAYDNQKNPFKKSEFAFFYLRDYTKFGANNVVRQKAIYSGGGIAASYSYEYNTEGYPLKQTDNNGNVQTYSYNYK